MMFIKKSPDNIETFFYEINTGLKSNNTYWLQSKISTITVLCNLIFANSNQM